MSFILSPTGGLVRDLWPAGIGHPNNDTECESDMPRWKKMPSEFDDLAAWLITETPAQQEDHRERTMALYHPAVCDGEVDERYEVAIRVQGFVEQVNISPLGNWSGREADAPKAIQFLRLGHGGFPAALDAQNEALRAFREVVLQSLHAECRHGSSSNGSISLQRRVFTRVRPVYATEVASVLREGDDAFGRAAKIASRWVVSHRINVGVQQRGGAITQGAQGSHLLVRKGDFVDVAVFAEIYKTPTRKGIRMSMNLAMHDVVRLYTARELKSVLGACSADVPNRIVPCAVGFSTGFTFADSLSLPVIEDEVMEEVPAQPRDDEDGRVGDEATKNGVSALEKGSDPDNLRTGWMPVETVLPYME
ncbi:hypothetical protein A0H81_09548 [Grifola frondosa]|uniref:Uncharacterized protein n=1 Tax=Grifola frondosa TaxID=5627 RepID=A0A1C7M1G6_GRIFR|nr:hypothetical protein A0H81_09548 [Grifola frondosa]